MKRYIFMVCMTLISCACCAQVSSFTLQGKCGKNTSWSFDGKTLTISKISKDSKYSDEDNSIPDYSLKNDIAPWIKKELHVRSVHIGRGITRIGSCAFANCHELTEVVFEGTDLHEIGWGAFYNCTRLRTISLPNQLRKVETIAFANCLNITSVKIPDQCRIEDQAYINCTGLQVLEVSPTATIGQYVFAHEVQVDGSTRHALYNAELLRVPSYMNSNNCNTFGISSTALNKYYSQSGVSNSSLEDYDYVTSEIDTVIPMGYTTRNDTYVLIIGNQNYRFAPDVPYAIHDARIFNKYCKTTLGIPSENIHIVEDATKQLINDDEFDWLKSIQDREEKALIVYYAGHGVPDTKNNNKAYLLPTDVRGAKPQNGIALDDFYASIGDLAFRQSAVFLDACFSGINRDNESVNEGVRGVEIAAKEGTLENGNIVVFSAAQGNETAQGYPEQGHGLFTYYLLKKIQDSEGYVFYGDLANYLKKNVSRQSLNFKQRKSQTPTVNTTKNLEDAWKDMGL